MRLYPRCGIVVARIDSHVAHCDRPLLHWLWPPSMHHGALLDIAWETDEGERHAHIGKMWIAGRTTLSLPPLVIKGEPGDQVVTQIHRGNALVGEVVYEINEEDEQ